MVNPMEPFQWWIQWSWWQVFFCPCFLRLLNFPNKLTSEDVRFQTLQMLDLRRLHEHGSNGHRQGKLNRADLSGPIGQVGGLFCVQELRHRRGRKWCWSKQKVRDPVFWFGDFFSSGHHHFEANLHLRQKESSPRGRNLRFGLLTILLSLRGFLCEVIDLMVFFRLTCCLLAHPFGTLCLKSWNLCRYLMDVESKVRFLDFWWQKLSRLLDRKGPTRFEFLFFLQKNAKHCWSRHFESRLKVIFSELHTHTHIYIIIYTWK